MKKSLLISVSLLVFVSACQPIEPSPTATPQSTATSIPTSTLTSTPTLTATPTITLTSTPNIPPWPLFQKGDWGQPEIFVLQRLLRYHGFTLIADGKFGGQTRAVVMDFQTAKGIPADGLVGQITWTALVEDVLVQEGDKGEAVRALQHILQFKFGYSIEINGAFGSETTEAVKDFQALVNLAPDGVVGSQTWHALISVKPSKP